MSNGKNKVSIKIKITTNIKNVMTTKSDKEIMKKSRIDLEKLSL